MKARVEQIGAAGGQVSSSDRSSAALRRLSDRVSGPKRRATILLAAAVLAAAAPPLAGQSGPGADARIVATLAAVDAVNRTIALRGSRGEFVTMDVSEAVGSLARMKVGDRVVVSYAQALALELRKGGDRHARAAAPADRPAGGVGRELKIRADVVLVNIHKQTVTLRGAEQRLTLKLRDPAQLKTITAGDQVEAIYTQALAMAVKAAPKTTPGD
jgi:Cu/Ag efflux protein CusF